MDSNFNGTRLVIINQSFIFYFRLKFELLVFVFGKSFLVGIVPNNLSITHTHYNDQFEKLKTCKGDLTPTNMRYAIHDMQYAICNLQLAILQCIN